MTTHSASSTPSRSLMTIACSSKTAVHVNLATPVPQEKKGALSDTTVLITLPSWFLLKMSKVCLTSHSVWGNDQELELQPSLRH